MDRLLTEEEIEEKLDNDWDGLDRVSLIQEAQQAVLTKLSTIAPDVREKVAKVICTFSDDDSECKLCAVNGGCPDGYPDVAEQVNTIHALYARAIQAAEQKVREEVTADIIEKLNILSQTYSLYIPEIRIHELRQSLGGS